MDDRAAGEIPTWRENVAISSSAGNFTAWRRPSSPYTGPQSFVSTVKTNCRSPAHGHSMSFATHDAKARGFSFIFLFRITDVLPISSHPVNLFQGSRPF